MNPVFVGTVKKGKLELLNQEGFDRHLLTLENKGVRVVVKRIKKQRSLKENSYMWGVVYKILSEFIGYTKDEIHDAMGTLFLLDKSKVLPIRRSTTDLSTTEMEEYLENIRRFAATKLDCYIPLPREVELEKS